MILNDIELKISTQARAKLVEALNSLATDSSWVGDLQRQSLQNQILDLDGQVESYTRLISGELTEVSELNVKALANYLIKARIAKGVSQKELANFLNISEAKFKGIESGNYFGVSLSRALKIADHLNLAIRKVFDDSGQVIFDLDEAAEIQWNTFPIDEMKKRGWISEGRNAIKAAESFIKTAFGHGLQPALHRKTSYSGKTAHQASLLAWQAKVLSSAEQELETSAVPPFEFDDGWLTELVALSTEDEGPLQARTLLRSKGILLVYEPHLKGTYLDGAAMLSENGTPIIGITIRHDRLDNFWFVLMHELGHVFLHLANFGSDFVDENVGENTDSIEEEADLFALNALIPPETWKTAVSRVMVTEPAILGDAKRMGVHPAIVAGRLRKELKDYTKFSNLVGYGKVREWF